MRHTEFWMRWWAVVALAGLLPLLGAIAVLLAVIDQQQTDAIKTTLNHHAATAAADIERLLDGNIKLLAGLAQSSELDRGDIAQFAAPAARALAAHPDWRRLVLTDGRRDLLSLPAESGLASLLRDFEGLDPARGTQEAAVPGHLQDDIVLTQPVVRAGKEPYLLVASLNADAMNRTLQSFHLPRHWTGMVVDDRDRVVAANSAAGALPGTIAALRFGIRRDGAGQITSLAVGDGTEAYASAMPINGTSWHVVVAAPLAAAAAPYASLHDVLLGGTIVLILIAFFIVAEALIHGRQAIEARQEELTKRLNVAEERSRSKSTYLSAVSHELRTPLTAILGFAEMLQRFDPGKLTAIRVQDYAGDIRSAGEHLLSLINDLLDMAKIEAGKMELNDCDMDLVETIQAIMPMLQQQADAAGVKLAVDYPKESLRLYADPLKIRQCVINLVANAIKFTRPRGRVHLSLTREGNGVAIAVADTGIGIKPADLSKVFTEFGQLGNDGDRQSRGSGLGLPLTKRLIELHGGTIAIESSLGHGTVLTLRLPAERVSAAPPRHAADSNVIFLEGSGSRS